MGKTYDVNEYKPLLVDDISKNIKNTELYLKRIEEQRKLNAKINKIGNKHLFMW